MKTFMMNALWLSCLALGAAAAGNSLGQQPKISDGVVKLGVLTDFSGPYSDASGSGSVLAVELAIADFKAQFKPSFKIAMISADHQNKADIAAAKAREWFDTQGVDVIVDLVTTSPALAVMKLAKEKNRVTLVSGAASISITNEDCTDTNVHWTYDTYALANGTARAVVSQGGDSWFFITADYKFGHALEADAARVVRASGGNVLGSARHPFPGTDFSSFLLKAQSSGAKVIGLANAGTDAINSIKQAAEFGITPAQSLAGLLVNITDVHSLGLKATQGMYLTEGFYWDFDGETRAWSLSLQLEIVALQHQLTVYQRSVRRPRSRPADRILWSWMSRHWSRWREVLIFVRPATVTAWQRKRFQDHWSKLSRRSKPGRPPVPEEVKTLIRKISCANPRWDSPRIVGELHKLGIQVAKSTVEKYRVRQSTPPSPTWRAFLHNHVADLVCIDFFTVPTIRFKVLFILLVLAHDRRRVIHFNVTEHPTLDGPANHRSFPVGYRSKLSATGSRCGL